MQLLQFGPRHGRERAGTRGCTRHPALPLVLHQGILLIERWNKEPGAAELLLVGAAWSRISLGQEEAPALRGLSRGRGAGVPARESQGEGPSTVAEVGGFHSFTGSSKAHTHTAWGKWSCWQDTSQGSVPGAAAPQAGPAPLQPRGLPTLQTHPNKINKMPIRGGSQPVLRLDGTSPVPAWWEVDAGQGSYAKGLGREDKAGAVSGCRRPGVALRVSPVRRLSPRVMRPA